MIDRYYERYGRRPKGVAADNAYGNGELLQWLDNRGITPYIRVKEGPTPDLYGIEKFTYVPEENCYLCPAGKPLKYPALTQGPTGGGLGLASFLLGDVSVFNRTVSEVFDGGERQRRWFFYGQDTFRVTHNLTRPGLNSCGQCLSLLAFRGHGAPLLEHKMVNCDQCIHTRKLAFLRAEKRFPPVLAVDDGRYVPG